MFAFNVTDCRILSSSSRLWSTNGLSVYVFWVFPLQLGLSRRPSETQMSIYVQKPLAFFLALCTEKANGNQQTEWSKVYEEITLYAKRRSTNNKYITLFGPGWLLANNFSSFKWNFIHWILGENYWKHASSKSISINFSNTSNIEECPT